MRVSLSTRLFVGFFTVSLVGLGTASYLLDRNVERVAYEQTNDRLRYEVTMTGQITASALFTPLARGDASLQGPVRDLGAAVQTHLSLVAPDGALAADSEVETVDPNASESDAPEVIQALTTGRGESIRGVRGAERLWVAEAIKRDGNVLGVARASVPRSVVEAQVTAVRKRLGLGAAVALLIAMASAFFIALGITRPVRRLVDAARRLGNGELTVRTGLTQNDELGELGRAVDDMATNLEQMVERLDARNADMRRVLDSVDQGLFTVDANGAISTERSARVDTWFAPEPGKPLWEMFQHLHPSLRMSLEIGWAQIVEDILPVEVAIEQLPKQLTCGSQVFALRYITIGEEARTRNVLVVITDVTQQVAAERAEAIQHDVMRVIERAQRDRKQVFEFLQNADDLVADAIRADVRPTDVMRHIHTLKGNCGLMGITTIATFCHELEDTLRDQERDLIDDERGQLHTRWSSLRVRIQSLLGAASGGISITREQYREVLDSALRGAPSEVTAQMLARWTLTSCNTSFERLAEHASTLATKLGKDVTLAMDSNEIYLDGDRWAGFWAAFVHAVRNAVDHGIETPEERVETGKSPAGRLSLRAEVDTRELVIELADDGRGINWSRIADRMRERGLPADSAEELVEGLYADGLSTASTVTELSGRGVGMGALRDEVRALGGSISVHSSTCDGTRIRCTFPAFHANVDPAHVLEREIAHTVTTGLRRAA